MRVTIKHYVFGLFCLFLVLHTLCFITTKNEIKESPEQIVKVEPTGKNSNTLSLKSKIDEINKHGQKVSNWATKVRQSFRKHLNEKGEEGNIFTPCQFEKKKEVKMENCDCTRSILTRGPSRSRLDDSTCSQDSYERGPGQKIIAFSYYGDTKSTKAKKQKYFEGIKGNVELATSLYPGWTLRIYYDLQPASDLHKDLCTLACNNPQLDICYVRQLPSKTDISKVFSALWRLYPVLDPDVDVYVSRDLDSRFNERELAAVGQWLQTTKHFHFMRDHPNHTAEVLAGMWGVSLGRYGSKIRQLLYESIILASNDPFTFWAPRNSYGPDQGFLKQYVWSWGKISSVQHDSYACQKYPQALPFPTQRLMGPNNFVGSVAASNNTLKEECPLPCRLKDHKDWKYC